MTAAQELLSLLEYQVPGPRHQPKPAPQPKREPGPMCRELPPTRVELPALGGCVEILYDWDPDVMR